MNKLTNKEKKQLIVRLIELHYQLCYDFTDLIAKPLSYFDYEKVKIAIQKFEKELEQINNH